MAKEVGSKILWESELKSLKEEFEGVRQDKTQDSQQAGGGFIMGPPIKVLLANIQIMLPVSDSNYVTCVLHFTCCWELNPLFIAVSEHRQPNLQEINSSKCFLMSSCRLTSPNATTWWTWTQQQRPPGSQGTPPTKRSG